MDKFINADNTISCSKGDTMKKILLSTLYGPDPVMLACTKLSPDKLILFISEKEDSVLEKSIQLIKNSLGRVLDVSFVKIPQYDIVPIAKKVVATIDKESINGEIIINITSGRKTQGLGLLYASYARSSKVKKITYYPDKDDKGSVIHLPILSMKLTDSQDKILRAVDSKKMVSHKTLADETGLSTAMIYRAVDDLINQGFLEKTEDEGILLTDAGKIAGM